MLLFLAMVNDEEIKSYVEYLYNEHKEISYKVAKRLLKSTQDVEDVVQHTFIKIVFFLEKNNNDSIRDEKAFIAELTRNTAINQFKVNKRNHHIPIDEIDELVNESFIEPEIHVLRLDNITEHTKKLMKLNEDYAYIIMLKYSEELTIPEIASLLDITEDNARRKLSRARKAYMKILKEGERIER